jgi:SAM-dependent methyltransferase
LKGFACSKDFYEPVNPDIVAGIPKAVRNVLSIGCGSGATEGRLVEMGMRVIAVPLDCVISGTAAGRGVEIINGDFALARNRLSQERFDCLLFQNILHLVEDPVKILSSFGELLEGPALVYIVIPNMFRPKAMLGKFLGDDPISYERNGAHFTSHRVVKKWLKTAGMKHQRTTGVIRGPRAQKASRLTFGLIDSFLYSEMLTIARK